MGTKKTIENSLGLKEEFRTNSAFLIPLKFMPLLKRLRLNGRMTDVLDYLLGKYRYRLVAGKVLSSSRVKTSYQARGLDLVRVSFTPDNEDWVLLGLFALGFGLSKSKLFVLLLDWENGEWLGDGTVKEKPFEKTETSVLATDSTIAAILFSPCERLDYHRILLQHREWP